VLLGDLRNGGLVHILILFGLDTHALRVGFLSDFIGFASHSSFVTLKLRREEQETIDGDSHTILNHNDVTDMEVVVMGVFLNYTITENVADVLLVRLHARLDELLLFLPVD